MKLSANNFIKGLAKDLNPEYIDSQLFEDARNLINEFDGEDGSLVPMKGVDQIFYNVNWRDSNFNLFDTATVIAVKYVATIDKIIYFLKLEASEAPVLPDYLDNDFILMINSSGVIEEIMCGYDLEFDTSYEYHIDYVVSNGKEFIFWIDNGYTAPKYIDVDVAKNEFTALARQGTPAPEVSLETFINVCKKPPVSAPIIEYTTDNSFNQNLLLNKFFQFKYRYNYEDGSVSAFSPESKIDPQINGFIGGVDTYYSTNKVSFNNAIKVTMTGVGGVQSIDLAYKESNLSEWSYVNIGVVGTYYFKNNTIGISLGSTPLDTKYYDNVPLKALSQTYIEQLLAYGGYTDGYDNVAIDSYSQIDYNSRWSLANRVFAETSSTDAVFWFDLTLSNINSIISVGDFVTINIQIANDAGEECTVQISIQRELSDATEFMNQIRDELTKYAVFTNKVNLSSSYALVTELDAGNSNKLKVTLNYLGSQIGPVTWSNQLMAFSVRTKQVPSLKSGEVPNIGVVYYDQFNRQGAVNVISNSPLVLETSQQLNNEQVTNVLLNESPNPEEYNPITNAGLRIAFNNLAPDWATHYQLVYSNGNLPKNILDFNVTSATEVPADGVWKLTINNSYQDINLSDSLFSNESVVVYKYSYFDIGLGYPVIVGGDDASREIKLVDIYIESDELIAEISIVDYEYLIGLSWGKTDLLSSTLQLKTVEKDSVFTYYEIGEKYSIDSNQRHQGNVQNQVANDTVIGTITSANISPIAEGSMFGGIHRAIITDATLWSYPDGTPITVYNTSTTVTSNGFIVKHGASPRVAIEVEDAMDGAIDYIFTVKNYASSIIDLGTVFLSEMIGLGTAPANYDDYYGYKIYSVIESYSPIPIQFKETGQDANALKVPIVANDLGRVQIESINFQQIFRSNSLIGSQIMQPDTNFFGLTSFPNTSFSFKDLDAQYGQITSIVSRDTDIVVLQEARCGRVLVQKDIITTAQGDQSVSVSDKVFGQYVPYMGNVGIGKTFQSLQYYKGRIYFKGNDGDIYRLSTDGLTEISELGMKHYFNQVNVITSFSGFMPEREEYIVKSESGAAAVFSTVRNQWCPFIEVAPNKMSRFNDYLVSFSGISVFIHEKTENYNELFDSNGDKATLTPTVSISANDQKGYTKIYETLEISGEKLDLLTVISISTKDATSPDVGVVLLESSWVAELSNGSFAETLGKEYVGIGIPLSFELGAVVFPGGINTDGFQIGDSLVSWDGTSITNHGAITSINGSSLGIAVAPNVSFINDQFIAFKSSSVEGSDLRGLYLRMTLSLPANNEYFRVNSVSTFGAIDESHEK